LKTLKGNIDAIAEFMLRDAQQHLRDKGGSLCEHGIEVRTVYHFFKSPHAKTHASAGYKGLIDVHVTATQNSLERCL
jgi:hypothetical protein